MGFGALAAIFPDFPNFTLFAKEQTSCQAAREANNLFAISFIHMSAFA